MDDLLQFDGEIRRPLSVVSPSGSLDGLLEEKAKLEKISFVSMSSTLPPSRRHHDEPTTSTNTSNATTATTHVRLNKFVRRLHEMLSREQGRGVVEWRRGVLVLHSINTVFSKEILPKYFGSRNFKTFRRQLNYYGFLHVRSSSATGSSASTALWVNRELADGGFDSISSVLRLKRVESCAKKSARREVKFDAATLFAVEKLVPRFDCDGKHAVHCQQPELAKAHDALAAGLLLSLADAAA